MGSQKFAQRVAYWVMVLFTIGYFVWLKFPDRKIDPTIARATLAVVGWAVGNAFHVTFIKKPKDGPGEGDK